MCMCMCVSACSGQINEFPVAHQSPLSLLDHTRRETVRLLNQTGSFLKGCRATSSLLRLQRVWPSVQFHDVRLLSCPRKMADRREHVAKRIRENLKKVKVFQRISVFLGDKKKFWRFASKNSKKCLLWMITW